MELRKLCGKKRLVKKRQITLATKITKKGMEGIVRKKPVHKRPIGRVFDPKRGQKSRNNVPLK